MRNKLEIEHRIRQYQTERKEILRVLNQGSSSDMVLQRLCNEANYLTDRISKLSWVLNISGTRSADKD